MMKRIFAALAMFAGLSGFSVGAGVEDLGWMSGRWVEERGESWAEENWSRPRGGVMLGTSLVGKAGRAAAFEFMRIAEGDRPGEVRFWASPGGKASVAFRMVRKGVREVEFENPENDYPTRIRYRREGRVLSATISGPGGANAQSWRFRRR
jgi:hypothetical protein